MTQPGFSEKSRRGGEKMSIIWFRPGRTEREVWIDGGGITVSEGAAISSCSSSRQIRMGEAVQPLYGEMDRPYDSANLFLAIKIEGLRPPAEFAAAASGLADRVRASRVTPGAAPVRVPGDRAASARSRFDGHCPLGRETLEALCSHATRLGVPVPAALAAPA